MVDKGCYTEDECNKLRVEIIQPPYLHNRSQFSAEDATRTAIIAHARVLVERVVARLKMYRMLRDISSL